MKKKIQFELDQRLYKKLYAIKKELGLKTVAAVLRTLIDKKKIRAHAHNDLVQVVHLNSHIIARMQVILNSEFTRGEVKAWFQELIEINNEMHYIMKKYIKK